MYKFNLQAVLEHRRFVEDNLKKELAEAKQRVLIERRNTERLTNKEMKTIAALQQEQYRGLTSNQVVTYQVFLTRLAQRIVDQEAVLADALAVESAKQNELLEAMKKRQILEKLKDQGLDRYNREMLKKEMEFIDEIAVNQFVRKAITSSGDDI
jgi:flagellar FliJ protein